MEEEKFYLDAREFLRDAWRLGRRVLDSGWRPDVLLAIWRGGAAPGAALHEFLKVHGLSMRHAPVKCSSYTGIGESKDEVVFEHADGVLDSIAPGERVLVVDDVFDTGRTAAAVRARLQGRGCDLRIACVYWKPSKNVTSIEPDFFTRVLERWIVFPHEMEGLTPEEINKKDPLLASLVRI